MNKILSVLLIPQIEPLFGVLDLTGLFHVYHTLLSLLSDERVHGILVFGHHGQFVLVVQVHDYFKVGQVFFHFTIVHCEFIVFTRVNVVTIVFTLFNKFLFLILFV